MRKRKNTYSEGILRFFYYPNGKKHIGVCADLCIVVEEADKELTAFKLMAASKDYLMTVIEKDLGAHLLNQEAPDELVSGFIDYLKKTKVKEEGETRNISIEEIIHKSEEELAKC